VKLFREMYTFMAPGERRLFWVSLAIRTALVLLDIVGLGLLGISVSIASGAKFIGNSITGHIFSWLNSFTSNNAYAVVAGLSILFFVLKGGLSIALNFSIARGLARYQYKRASRLFHSILKSRLETLEKWSPSDYSYGLGGALDDVFGRLVSSISTAYGEGILMLGISCFLIYTSPILFLILAMFFALVGWVLYASSTRRVRVYAKKLTEATILSGNTVLDMIANFRQVSTSSSVDGLTEVFTRNRRVMAINQEKITTFSSLPRYIMEMAMMLGIGLLVIQRSTGLAQSVSASVIAIFIGGALRLAASLLPLQGAFAMLSHIGENAKMPLEMLRAFDANTSLHAC
jgi:ABC-type siderophore export system fused ATPase/permease subunit